MGRKQKIREKRKELGYKPGDKTSYQKIGKTINEKGDQVVTHICTGLRGEYLREKKGL